MTTKHLPAPLSSSPHTVINRALRTVLRNKLQAIFAIKSKCAQFCAIKTAE